MVQRTYQLVKLSNLRRKARGESVRAANDIGREPIRFEACTALGSVPVNQVQVMWRIRQREVSALRVDLLHIHQTARIEGM